MSKIFLYLKNLLLAIDQLVNAILFGSPDETLSSRAYRAHANGKIFGKIFKPIINFIFFLEEDHCYDSYLSEVEKRQLPSAFRIHELD